MTRLARFPDGLRRLMRSCSRRFVLAPAMVILLAASPLASAQYLQAPYVSYISADSYSVSYLCPAVICYLEENGEYILGSEAEGPYGGGGAFYQAKPNGVYTYRVLAADPFAGALWYGPDSVVTIPIPPPPPALPKPVITPSVTRIGPVSNPSAYELRWTATDTYAEGCIVRMWRPTSSNPYPAPIELRNLEPTGEVITITRIAGVDAVWYEIKCTGPGGTTELGDHYVQF